MFCSVTLFAALVFPSDTVLRLSVSTEALVSVLLEIRFTDEPSLAPEYEFVLLADEFISELFAPDTEVLLFLAEEFAATPSPVERRKSLRTTFVPVVLLLP